MNSLSTTQNSSNCSENVECDQNEQIKICCFLDCVSCLLMVHRETFMEENNQNQYKKVQSFCALGLNTLFETYKVLCHSINLIVIIFL